MTNLEKIELILSHIKRVESNMQFLAKELLKENERENLNFCLQLLQGSRLHDVTKLNGDEFHYLNSDYIGTKEFKEALHLHQKSNSHHPEFYGAIYLMDEVDIAEMACDLFARGQEFGTNTMEWIETVATKKYRFEMTDRVGTSLKKYIEILTKNKFK